VADKNAKELRKGGYLVDGVKSALNQNIFFRLTPIDRTYLKNKIRVQE
jgi:hypothetical protein